MKALVKLIERDKGQVTAHVTAPPEWWDLLNHGHSLPLEIPAIFVTKREQVRVVIHEAHAPKKDAASTEASTKAD